MNRHLSSRQFSLWMAGERIPEEQQHVRECPECAGELARFKGTLALFRGSVRHWSEQQAGSAAGEVLQAGPAGNRFRVWPAGWAAVAAALLLVAMVPVYRSTRHPRRGESMAPADAVLLEQVDAEVSRAVPRPMEPLLELMSWNSSDGQDDVMAKENDETTQKQ